MERRSSVTTTASVPSVPSAPGSAGAPSPNGPAAQDRAPRLDERLLAEVLEALPDPALVCGPDGRIRIANRPAQDFFAPLLDRSLIGADLAAACARLRPAAAPQGFDWKALLEPEAAARHAQGIEVRDAPEDDPVGRDALVRVRPCRDAGGRPAAWIVVLTELTALRTAERLRDHALRFLSHDMRAPMASLLALLELREAHESVLPPDALIDLVDRYARRGLTLAENFLLLARAMSRPLQLQPTDILQCAQDAVDEAWSLARARPVQLTLASPEGEELWIMGERQLLTLAVGQLLHNAIAHAPPQSTVTVALRSEPAAALPVLVAVRDQGPGIPEAERENLLKPRLHGAMASGRGGGPGLGLTFVEVVAGRHGGRVSIADAPGGGAEFRLHLPACRE